MAVFTLGGAGEAQSEDAHGGPQEVDVDELVTVRERERERERVSAWVHFRPRS